PVIADLQLREGRLNEFEETNQLAPHLSSFIEQPPTAAKRRGDTIGRRNGIEFQAQCGSRLLYGSIGGRFLVSPDSDRHVKTGERPAGRNDHKCILATRKDPTV